MISVSAVTPNEFIIKHILVKGYFNIIPEGYYEKGLTLKYKSKLDQGNLRELGYS